MHVLNSQFAFQNGKVLNVNYTDNNLRDLVIPQDLLLKVHLMRCPNDYDTSCTSSGAKITDFNIWDRSFSVGELTNWTTCRYIKFDFGVMAKVSNH
jgi:hypothetical protein